MKGSVEVYCHRKSMRDPKTPHNKLMEMMWSGPNEKGYVEGYECCECGNSVFIVVSKEREDEK